MAYFDDKTEIECPYCKTVNKQEEWYPDQNESTTIECENCEKEYTITASYSISITTTCGPKGSEYTKACEYRSANMGEPKMIAGQMKIYGECVHCEETAFVLPDKITVKGGE